MLSNDIKLIHFLLPALTVLRIQAMPVFESINVSLYNRMHCKIMFNFALRHSLAFSITKTRKAIIGLSNLDLISQ